MSREKDIRSCKMMNSRPTHGGQRFTCLSRKNRIHVHMTNRHELNKLWSIIYINVRVSREGLAVPVLFYCYLLFAHFRFLDSKKYVCRKFINILTYLFVRCIINSTNFQFDIIEYSNILRRTRLSIF